MNTANGPDPTLPLSPKLSPTFKGHRLSPFWFTSNNISTTTKSGDGGGSDPNSASVMKLSATTAATFQQRVTASLSAGPATKAPQFSMLHAAAITGDKVGLQKLASGNFCDIDLKDKVIKGVLESERND